MAAVIRNAIERTFCRLKDFRRVATRYGRNAVTILAAVRIAAAASYRLWRPDARTSPRTASSLGRPCLARAYTRRLTRLAGSYRPSASWRSGFATNNSASSFGPLMVSSSSVTLRRISRKIHAPSGARNSYEFAEIVGVPEGSRISYTYQITMEGEGHKCRVWNARAIQHDALTEAGDVGGELVQAFTRC